MLRIKSILLITVFSCILIACDAKIAVNKEPVFNSYKPESKEYRNKLAEKITTNQNDLTCVFDKYIDANTIEVIVSGKDFAANCLVTVNDWTGMEGIKKAKGGGYSHVELDGLQLDIKESPEGAVFIYENVASIID